MSEQPDHDHAAEDAFLSYVNNPTPANAQAAELAIALLQRRHDHLLLRLDEIRDPSVARQHRHDPAEDPARCAEEVLHDLAGGQLADPTGTLVHGLEAVSVLERQRDEARVWAQLYYHRLLAGMWDWGRFRLERDAEPVWMTQPQNYPRPD